MLVLSRQRLEEIVISHGGKVIGRIAVVDIRGDKVRLGFDFPIEYSIHRAEVQELIDAQSAGLPVPSPLRRALDDLERNKNAE